MKTEELKTQGLTDEQIAFVMSENGKDVKREKDRAEGFKTQLDTAKEQLKAFEGKDFDKALDTAVKDLRFTSESAKKAFL